MSIKLYVGNLSFKSSEGDLEELFPAADKRAVKGGKAYLGRRKVNLGQAVIEITDADSARQTAAEQGIAECLEAVGKKVEGMKRTQRRIARVSRQTRRMIDELMPE